MTTQDSIDEILELMRTVVDKKGTTHISDGHCTFGVEYPSLSRQSDGITYFSALDLHGRFFFTDKTMKGVLQRVRKHIKEKHGL